jgi:hypothetical protein
MIFEQTPSPPPAPIASKKRRLSYGVIEEEEGSFMMSPPRASPVGMYNSLFIPDLDEKPHHDSNGRSFLRPRLEDSTTYHFHLLHRPSSKRHDFNSNSSLPWFPDVPTLDEEDEVKSNSKRSRPPAATIRPTRKLLPELEEYAACA